MKYIKRSLSALTLSIALVAPSFFITQNKPAFADTANKQKIVSEGRVDPNDYTSNVVYTVDINGENFKEISSQHVDAATAPSWSLDGQKISMYTSKNDGTEQAFLITNSNGDYLNKISLDFLAAQEDVGYGWLWATNDIIYLVAGASTDSDGEGLSVKKIYSINTVSSEVSLIQKYSLDDSDLVFGSTGMSLSADPKKLYFSYYIASDDPLDNSRSITETRIDIIDSRDPDNVVVTNFLSDESGGTIQYLAFSDGRLSYLYSDDWPGSSPRAPTRLEIIDTTSKERRILLESGQNSVFTSSGWDSTGSKIATFYLDNNSQQTSHNLLTFLDGQTYLTPIPDIIAGPTKLIDKGNRLVAFINESGSYSLSVIDTKTSQYFKIQTPGISPTGYAAIDVYPADSLSETELPFKPYEQPRAPRTGSSNFVAGLLIGTLSVLSLVGYGGAKWFSKKSFSGSER